MGMHHGHAAWRDRVYSQQGHAAWTFSMGKQHRDMDMEHGHEAKKCSITQICWPHIFYSFYYSTSFLYILYLADLRVGEFIRNTHLYLSPKIKKNIFSIIVFTPFLKPKHKMHGQLLKSLLYCPHNSVDSVAKILFSLSQKFANENWWKGQNVREN
jgi:hypothetical protein